MKKLCLAIIASLLVLASAPSKEKKTSTIEPATVTGWAFEFSPGTSGPTPVGTGFTFQFPDSDGVHYVTRDGMQLIKQVTISGNVTIKGAPVFERRDTCAGKAEVRVYLQRRGDNWSAQGDYQYYRWWYRSPVEIKPGSFWLIAPLSDKTNWSSVYGKTAADAPAQLRAALNDIGRIGLTFGGGCSYGHGVWVKPGTGSATFTIHSFTAE